MSGFLVYHTGAEGKVNAKVHNVCITLQEEKKAGGNFGNDKAGMILLPSKWLKLIGFFINICASLFLIRSVLIGEGKPSLLDFVRRKKPWRELWKELTGTRIYEIGNQNRKALITSALVIIGSSFKW